MVENVTVACRDLNKLSANGKAACELFLNKCDKAGLKVLVTETYRSQARQTYLYEQGRTRPGQIVTQIKKVGYHNTGNAWDICKNVKGQEYSDSAFFRKCGEIAKSLGIEWGGYWKGFVDTPHFQISDDWIAPKAETKEDIELSKAVSSIIKSGIKIEFNQWKRMDLFNINNVAALLTKLGGIDGLISKGVISSADIWESKKYNSNHVRSLIIKFSSKL